MSVIRTEMSHFQSWQTTCPVTSKRTTHLWGPGLEFLFPLLLTRDLAVLSELDVTSLYLAWKAHNDMFSTVCSPQLLLLDLGMQNLLTTYMRNKGKYAFEDILKFPFHLFHSPDSGADSYRAHYLHKLSSQGVKELDLFQRHLLPCWSHPPFQQFWLVLGRGLQRLCLLYLRHLSKILKQKCS